MANDIKITVTESNGRSPRQQRPAMAAEGRVRARRARGQPRVT
jgi:hypothetical protein